MKLLGEYTKKIWKLPALFAVFVAIMAGVLFLYDVPSEPVLYGTVICAVFGIASFFYGYYLYQKRRETLLMVQKNLPWDFSSLPLPEEGNERIYQEMLLELNRKRMEAETGKQQFYREVTDYYTLWAHQIKTPVSAMHLLLQTEEENREGLLSELVYVEQYVEMVLGYLRSEDISSDMKFEEYDLDGIIREQIHKYARIFVRKKLSLEYGGVEERVLTDAKWLGFVIGQLLSNALKYTREGGISISMSETRPHTLVIADTGIGIRPEDLPRVFEKGFTGYNGREETRSTGIGLYLCAKILKKLNHEISLESAPGEGTRVLLLLERKELEIY